MQLTISRDEAARAQGRPVALEDTILTLGLPTSGGSRMLEGYHSLFEAEVATRLKAAGFAIAAKANVGEFGIDLLGETSYFGAVTNDAGELATAASALVAAGEVEAVVAFDVNGAPRRGAALAGQVCVKPTYGCVSRFGTIAAACSGETVSVVAANASTCKDVLAAIAGHDSKDGTSLPEELIAQAAKTAPITRVAVARGLVAAADEATQARIASFVTFLQAQGVEVVEIDDAILLAARPAWNILMSAELCNNVSRFDGVKYGYRTPTYETIGELYTNSRTEAFGDLLKYAVLFGSECLSTEKYDAYYDKALRIRRVVVERFAELFGAQGFDAILMPACGKASYSPADVAAAKDIAFTENAWTAPASIAGLPAVVVGSIQLVGKAFAEGSLLDVAAKYEEASR